MSRATQEACYAAERVAVALGPRYTPAEAQDVVDGWLQGEMSTLHPWLRSIEVVRLERGAFKSSTGASAMAHADQTNMTGTVYMLAVPTIAESTLIHEVSHVLCNLRHPTGGGYGHGEVFLRMYLEWIYRLRGTEAWLEFKRVLNAELAHRGVPCVG